MPIRPPLPSHRRGPTQRPAVALLTVLVVVLAACGGNSSADAGPLVPGENFTVVADLDPIADLVREVAGDRAEVVSLVPTGLDGHTYQPRTNDVATIATAHLLVSNGGGLNVAVEDLAEQNLPRGSPLVRLAEEMVRPDELLFTDVHSHDGQPEHGHGGNVHLWTNPPYAVRYVQRIATALAEVDPAGEEVYRTNAAELTGRLLELSDAIGEAVATIPPADRQLVVYHDSWSYFGRNYGLEVVGAIQPADFSEPSAAELAAMIEQIRAADVPAFFGSEVFPSDVLDAVARESGATYVADLNDDRLPGEPGDPVNGYVGMMAENVRTIVGALGGDTAALDGFPGGAGA